MSEEQNRHEAINKLTYPPYAKGRKDWIVKVRCVYEEEIELNDCTEDEARREPWEHEYRPSIRPSFPTTDPISTEVLEQRELT